MFLLNALVDSETQAKTTGHKINDDLTLACKSYDNHSYATGHQAQFAGNINKNYLPAMFGQVCAFSKQTINLRQALWWL
ncbi:MAG: hypothetical protein CTY19_11550 [Methylomonas sp.]|nr:MAG: hypothetical protein CTY19_11550 [Methylomonas sp.]